MARIGVIGAGRVGAVLGAAFATAGHEIVAVAGESIASRERIAALLPQAPIMKPTSVARACEVLLLTVPDDMLENVVVSLVGAGVIRSDHYVVHTSGAHGLQVLEAATAVGAHPVAMHPAMTFTGTALDLPRLNECAFGVTSLPEETGFAAGLVADLGGRAITVPEESRTLYHASLAHGANHLVTLVNQAMAMLGGAGVDDPAAVLRPLLEAALDNSLNQGQAALTGPIVRGDVRTVQAHLDELARSAPSALPTYVTMAKATAIQSMLEGRLLPIRGGKLIALLEASQAAYDGAGSGAGAVREQIR